MGHCNQQATKGLLQQANTDGTAAARGGGGGIGGARNLPYTSGEIGSACSVAVAVGGQRRGELGEGHQPRRDLARRRDAGLL
jgi:hypothetical protein